MIETTSKFLVKPTVHAVTDQDDLVLVDLENEVFYGTDLVGLRIWDGLAGGHSYAQILQTITLEFDAEPETLQRDVADFIEMLLVKGLIEPG